LNVELLHVRLIRRISFANCPIL